MTTAESQSNAPNTLKLTSTLILASGAAVLTAHMMVFGLYMPVTESELRYWHGEDAHTLFGLFLNTFTALFGSSVFAARSVSMLCGLITLILTARLAVRWSGDAVSGAAVCIGFLLFPTVAYGFAQAMPYALVSLVTVAAMNLIFEKETNRSQILVSGGLCGLLPIIHPIGLCAGALVLAIVAWRWRMAPRTVQFVCASGATVLVFSFLWPLLPSTGIQPQTNQTTQPDGLAAMVLPYAMLWVAWLFAAMSLAASRSLRDVLAPSGVQRSWVLLVGFVVIALVAAVWPPGQPGSLQTAFGALVVLGVLAALPMVMWIRLVMPNLKSIAVWIVLPVVMYSCFWVVLGPIDLQGFPYDQLDTGTSGLSAQFPR